MTDSPAGKVEQPQGQPDSPQIPKARLDEEIGKRRELESRLAELSDKLNKMDKGVQTQAEVEAFVKQRLEQGIAPLEKQLAAARLANQNGWSEDASNLVLEYQSKGLDQTEAMAAAKAKKPELFTRKGDESFRASQHGILPPQSNAPRVEADDWNFQEKAKTVRSPGEAKDLIMEDLRRRDFLRTHKVR